MGVTSIYHKRCKFNINTSATVSIQDLGMHNITIPVITATWNEVRSEFGALPATANPFDGSGNLNTSWASFFELVGSNFSRFPNLEYTRRVETRIGDPHASYFAGLASETITLLNAPYSTGYLFINYGGLGFRCCDGSTGDGFIHSISGSAYALNVATYCGITRTADNSLSAGLGGMCITSDNHLVWWNSRNNRYSSMCAAFTIDQTNVIKAWLEGLPEPEPEGDDPYDPDGPSEPGGGDGEFDDPTEPVPIPDPPSISVVDTGFITLFNPSLSELKSLANYMWSDLFSVDTFKKIFADPMQAILGLSIVPVNVPSAGSKEVVVGNIRTGINMTAAAKQFISFDCGSLTVKGHWNAYLDYDPYTKCFIHLPYIGTHPIAADDIMNRTVRIKYNFDILSGACTAFIESGGVVIYEFIGQAASCIPITGDNFSNVINGVLGIAGSVGTMVATGGLSTPLSAEVTAAGIGAGISGGAALAQNVMGMKPSIEKSGSTSGTGGLMGVQKPYLIMLRPNQAIPGGQNQYIGYPAFITARLGDITGYTEVESVHLENIPCTEEEQNEITRYLLGGVIL